MWACARKWKDGLVLEEFGPVFATLIIYLKA